MQQYSDFLKYQGHSVPPRYSQQQLQEVSRLTTCSCPCLANLNYNESFDSNAMLGNASVPLAVIHGFYDDRYGMRYEISPSSTSINEYYNPYRCPHVDESFNLPHNKGKKYYVEDNQMSFVGMFAVDNGVVAFGDTRSTIYNTFGMQCQEKGRVAKKVFEGKNFLLTTWNANRYCSCLGKEEAIEDFIEKNIEELSPLELLSLFVEKVSENEKNKERDFRFGIGYKLHGKYVVQEAYVKQNMLSFFPPTRIIWVGIGFYKEKLSQLENNTIDDAFVEIQCLVESIMDEANTFDGYNPAGSPFYFGMLGDYSGKVEIGKF